MKNVVKAIGCLSILVLCAATLRAAPEIGLNITQGSADRSVEGEAADGMSNWTDSDNDAGSDWNWGDTVLNGSGGDVTATWTCNNRWGAGNAAVPDQQLYREYLDDNDATGGSPYTELAQASDGFGAAIRLTGLSDWLADEGALYYRIRVYFSTDTHNTTFRTVSIRGGTDITDAEIGTIVHDVIGDGGFPTARTGSNTRGYGDSELLTADSVVLAAYSKSGTVRGAIAAVKVTALVVDPAGYAHSMDIEFSGYTKTETLTNFPVLVKLGSGSGGFHPATAASTNGADLRFTTSDDTSIIPHEIEDWDASGISTVWVQVPELTSNTTIKVHWGNAGAITFDPDTFDPDADVNGLVAWYDAGWGVATGATSMLTTWTNREGTASLNLDSSGGDKPSLVANSVNGLPAVDFDGVNDRIFNATGQDFHQPNTIFMVVRADDASMNRYAFDGTSTSQRHAAFVRSGSTGWDTYSGVEMTDNIAVNTGSFEVHAFTFYGTQGKHYIDGRLVRSGNVGTHVFQAVILGSRVSQTEFLDGAIAEFLLYDALLTDQSQSEIGTYLANKYALSTSYRDPDSPAYTSDGSTWDEHYLGVWHLADAAASGVADSTGNEQVGVGSGSPTFDAAGIAGPAVDLSGSSQFINLPDLGGKTRATVECWFKGDSFSGTRGLVSQPPWAAGHVHFKVQGGNDLAAHMNNGGGITENDQISASTWYHAGYTFGGAGLINLYRDGLSRGSGAGNGHGTVQLDVNIGHEYDGRYFDGIMDEVRVSDVSRSENWMWASHENQRDTSHATFNDYGSVPMYWDSGTAADLQPGNGNWETSSNFWSSTTSGDDPLLTWSDGADAVFQTNGASTITVGAVSANSLTFNGTGYTLSGGTITLDDGDIVANEDATIDSVLTGAATLTKAGAGTLELSKNNTHSGGTVVNAGRLLLSEPANNGTGVIRGEATVNSGATLEASGPNAFGYSGGVKVNTLNVNTGTVVTSQTSGDNGWGITVNLDGGTITNNAGTGYISLGGGSAVNVTGDNTSTIGGNVQLRENVPFAVADGASDVDLLVSGVFFNNNSFTKSGDGRMLMTANNTYSGSTTVNGGILQVGNGGAVGQIGNNSGAATVNADGELQFYRSNSYTVNNAISGSGTLTFTGTAVSAESQYTIGGNNSSFSGDLIIDDARVAVNTDNDVGASTIAVNDGGQLWVTGGTISRPISLTGLGWQEGAGQLGAVRLDGTLSGAVTLTGDTRISPWGSNGTITGDIGESGGSRKLTFFNGSGTPVVRVAGNNTYSGGTRVDGAQYLRIANDAALGAIPGGLDPNNLELAWNGRLMGGATTGNDITLNANRGVSLVGGTGYLHAWTGYTITINGPVTGAGNLRKSDGGTAIIAGACDYTGTTYVETGMLEFSGTGSTITNSVTINGNGRTLSVASGGDVSCGAISMGGGSGNRTLSVAGSLAAPSVFASWPSTIAVDGDVTVSGTMDFAPGTTACNVSGTGTVDVGNFTVRNGGNINFGVSGTTLSTPGAFYLGNGNNQRGHLHQSDGTVNLTSSGNNIRFSHWNNTGSSYNMTGGTLNVPNTGVYVTWHGAGAFTINGASAVANVKGLRVGSRDSTVTLTAGTLNVGSVGIVSAGSYTKTINLGAGTLGATEDWSSSLPMSLTDAATGTSLDGSGGAITLSGILSGAGRLNMTGGGTAVLSNDNTYTGPTVVSDGALLINGSHTTGGGVTINGGNLWGTGLVTNELITVNSGGTIGPAVSATLGTFAAENVTFADGGRVACIVNGATPSLNVSGSLTTTGDNWVDIVLAAPLTEGTYTLIDYTNSIAGAGFSAFKLAGEFGRSAVSLSNNTTDTSIQLVVGAAVPTNLVWRGNIDNDWDVTTTNWVSESGGSPLLYANEDTVTFDDTAVSDTVDVTTIVGPTFTLVDSDSTDFTFQGSAIGGSGNLVKDGTSILTLENANIYTGRTLISNGTVVATTLANGGVASAFGAATSGATNLVIENGSTLRYPGATVNFNRGMTAGSGGFILDVTNEAATVTHTGVLEGSAPVTKSGMGTLRLNGASTAFTGNVTNSVGILRMGNKNAFGAFVGGRPVTQITVEDGAMIDFNGVADATYGYTIAGAGIGGAGVIVNNGGGIGDGKAQSSNLKLTDDATIGGSGEWSLLGNSYSATSLDLAGFTLTKTGGNLVRLCNTTISGGGTIRVSGGTFGTTKRACSGSGTALVVDDTAGVGLQLNHNLTIGSISGGGASGGNMSLANGILTVGALGTTNTYSGIISGGGGIAKVGSGKLILDGVNTYSGKTDINLGVLEIPALSALGNTSYVEFNAASGTSPTLRYTGTGAESMTRTWWYDNGGVSAIIDISEASGQITWTPGGGTQNQDLTKAGAGTFIFGGGFSGSADISVNAGRMELTAANTYSGTTAINAGTLALGASGTIDSSPTIVVGAAGAYDVSAVSGYTVVDGQTLSGSGSVVGDVDLASGAIVAPGTSMGTLTITGNVSYAAMATNLFELGTSTVVGSGSNDLLVINGDVDFNDSRVVINALEPLAGDTHYVLMTYTGTRTGANILVTTGEGRKAYALDYSTSGEVRLLVTGASPTLVWNSEVDSTWDEATANWTNAAGSVQEAFVEGDLVEFTDSGAATNDITLSGSLAPGRVTVNSTSNYTFSGAGKVTGFTEILKTGTGVLSLNTTNDFSGGLNVQGGVINGIAEGFGGDGAAVSVQDGGAVDLAGVNRNAHNMDVTLSGTGASGSGAIYNSGASLGDYSGIRNVTLAADATVTADTRWDVRAAGTLDLAGHTLTKAGSDTIAIKSMPISAGTINVAAGRVAFESNFNGANSAIVDITVQNGANIAAYNARNIASDIRLTGATADIQHHGSSRSQWSGTITVDGGGRVNTSAGDIEISGTLAGDDTLNISGGKYASFTGSSPAFTGKFNVSGSSSTLRLASDAALGAHTGADTITLQSNGRIQGGTAGAGANVTVGAGRGITIPAGNNGYIHPWGGYTLTHAGTIAGAGNLYKTDSGTLVLTGTDSHTGETFVNAGTLTLSGSGAITQTSRFRQRGGGVTINVQDDASINATGYIAFGDNANSGGTINQSGGTVSNQGTANNPGGNDVANRWGHWGNAAVTYNLSGGTLNLQGAPLYLSWDSAATLNVSGTGVANIKGINQGYGRSNTSTINLNSGGTLNVGDSGLYTGNTANKYINLNGGTLGSLASWSSSRPMALTGTSTLSPSNTHTITLSGVLSGAGGFTKTGLGQVTLNADNTFTGGVTVNAGTVRAQGDYATRLAANNTVTMNDGGTFEVYSVNCVNEPQDWVINAGGKLLYSQNYHAHLKGSIALNGGTIQGDVRGAGKYGNEDFSLQADITVGGTNVSTISLANGAALSGSRTFTVADATGDAGTDFLVSGELEGSGSLIKAGPGAMLVDVNATYTGTTTVNGGALFMNATHSGAGNYTINTGATLSGSGTVGAGTTTIKSGATLDAGAAAASVGTLTLNALTMESGSTLHVDVASQSSADRVTVNGSVTLAGAITLSSNVTDYPASQWLIVSSTGAISGDLTPPSDDYFTKKLNGDTELWLRLRSDTTLFMFK